MPQQQPRYQEFQKKAKQLVEEGIDFLSSGFHTAEVLVGKTYQATQLHYKSKRSYVELYRTLHDLGHAIYETCGSSKKPPEQFSSVIVGLLGRIKDLEQQIVQAEKELEKSTVVKKTPPKQKHPPSPPVK